MLKRFTLGIVILGIIVTSLATCSNSTQTSQQPIEILSVKGPFEPYTPAGPSVEIVLENTSARSIVSLTATLKLIRDFNFEFDVSPSKPLLPGKSFSSRLTLIGGGFSTDTTYLLQIKGEIEDGTTFNFTEQVQIIEP